MWNYCIVDRVNENTRFLNKADFLYILNNIIPLPNLCRFEIQFIIKGTLNNTYSCFAESISHNSITLAESILILCICFSWDPK